MRRSIYFAWPHKEPTLVGRSLRWSTISLQCALRQTYTPNSRPSSSSTEGRRDIEYGNTIGTISNGATAPDDRRNYKHHRECWGYPRTTRAAKFRLVFCHACDAVPFQKVPRPSPLPTLFREAACPKRGGLLYLLCQKYHCCCCSRWFCG